MTDIKLKPCPFCGTEAHALQKSDGFEVECMSPRCRVFMPVEAGAYFISEDSAIDAWNRRANEKDSL